MIRKENQSTTFCLLSFLLRFLPKTPHRRCCFLPVNKEATTSFLPLSFPSIKPAKHPLTIVGFPSLIIYRVCYQNKKSKTARRMLEQPLATSLRRQPHLLSPSCFFFYDQPSIKGASRFLPRSNNLEPTLHHLFFYLCVSLFMISLFFSNHPKTERLKPITCIG